MENCLILLTNYFPFFKGEEYLESEIIYLSNTFDKIYIIATMGSIEMEQTRSVPNNVIVLKSEVSHTLKGKTKMFLNGGNIARKNISENKLLEIDGNSLLQKIYSFYFEARSMYIYSKIKRKLKGINFENYDTITIYSYWLYITARIGVELKLEYFKDRKTYLISRAHGYDINEHVNMLKFLPQREFLLNNIDNVFPVSQNGVDFLKRKYPLYRDKISVRRLGTRLVEHKKNNKNNVLYIVSCSTVRKLKRIDILIDSLKILQDKNIRFYWTHIGSGPQFNYIRRLALRKLKKDSYNFTGFIKNTEVINWYKNNRATVFVNTSESEGVPVSIMEAMSVSVPIVATDVGGTGEIVKHNKNGYLLSKKCTANEVASNLEKIHSMSVDEYMQMCKESYNIWNRKCNSEALFSNFAYEIKNKSI